MKFEHPFFQCATAVVTVYYIEILKKLISLGPNDRKFHGQSKNDGFVLYEYIIKQCNSFCKYTNIQTSALGKKRSKKITCQQ